MWLIVAQSLRKSTEKTIAENLIKYTPKPGILLGLFLCQKMRYYNAILFSFSLTSA